MLKSNYYLVRKRNNRVVKGIMFKTFKSAKTYVNKLDLNSMISVVYMITKSHKKSSN